MEDEGGRLAPCAHSGGAPKHVGGEWRRAVGLFAVTVCSLAVVLLLGGDRECRSRMVGPQRC